MRTPTFSCALSVVLHLEIYSGSKEIGNQSKRPFAVVATVRNRRLDMARDVPTVATPPLATSPCSQLRFLTTVTQARIRLQESHFSGLTCQVQDGEPLDRKHALTFT